MESPKVRHNWATYIHFTSLHAIVIRICLVPETCVLSAANWPCHLHLLSTSTMIQMHIYTRTYVYMCSFSDSFPLKVITKYWVSCANKRKPRTPPNQWYKMPCLSSLAASSFPGPTTSNQSIPEAFPFFLLLNFLWELPWWLRICLPVQGTPGLGSSRRATEPAHHT